MLAVGLCCANEQHTWESAQEFNESILKRITMNSTDVQACDITAVRETSFVVRCWGSGQVIKLPYTWGEWKIVSSGYDVVVYSNEFN